MNGKPCPYLDNGNCTKYRHRTPCDQLNGVTLEGFRLGRCDADEVCRNYSPWGNYCYIITDDDIEALKTGCVLYNVDEYGTFLIYQPSRKEAGPF